MRMGAGLVVGLAVVLGACYSGYGVADGGRELDDAPGSTDGDDDGDDDDADDDPSADGPNGDGSNGDGSNGDGSNGDGSNDDGPNGDGPSGDGSSGDGSNDDGSSDDGSSDDGSNDGGTSTGEDPGGTSGGEEAGVFEDQIVPILSARCGCHTDGSPAASLDLSPGAAYGELVGAPSSTVLSYVSPGSAADSYLVHKMQGTHNSVVGGGGSTMPPGAGSIPGAEIDAVIAWIEDGAL